MKNYQKAAVIFAIAIAAIALFFGTSAYIIPNVPQADSDNDGLLNSEENAIGTDPLVADTDNDGLSDGDEVNRELSPVDFDTDGDGLGDGAEVTRGTDPKDIDSDDDGLNDGQEVNSLHTDPLKADTDDDRLPDNEEIAFKTDPLSRDTDDDGATDYEEIYVRKTDPLNPDITFMLTIKDSATQHLVEGVTVYLDGRSMGSTTQQGTILLQTVSLGNHKVSITYENFGEIDVDYITVSKNTESMDLTVNMPNPNFQVASSVTTTWLFDEIGQIKIDLTNTGNIASEDTIALVFVYVEDSTTPVATKIVDFGNIAAGAQTITKQIDVSQFKWGQTERVAIAIVDRWTYTPQNNAVVSEVQVPVGFTETVVQGISTYIQQHPEIVGTIAKIIITA